MAIIQIESALDFIPAHNRETWLRVAMAIKDELGDSGFDLWDRWSQLSGNYNERDARSVWKSIKPSCGVTIATLYYEAKKNGWSDCNQGVSIDTHSESNRVRVGQEEAEQLKIKADSRKRANDIWGSSSIAPNDHPYLIKKGVRPHGIKVSNGALVIRLLSADGQIHGLQFIAPDGNKKFLSGTSKAGHYFPIGGPPESVICLAEGYATGASIHEATGHPVAVCFDAGNLKSVAMSLRDKHPDVRLIVCADDDRGTDGNPGLTKATETARTVGGLLAVPAFKDTADCGSDFNDLHQKEGFSIVREQVEKALPINGSDASEEETLRDDGDTSKIVVVDAARLLSLELPPRENLLSPWLSRQGLTMVYAPRGVGKTHFSLGVAYAVASGGKFMNWDAPKPAKVLFLDGEMPASVLQERLSRIVHSEELEPENEYLRIITPDLQPVGTIDLTSRKDQADLAQLLDDVDLIVVDNIATLCKTGKENEGESWVATQEWALQQRAEGRSVLFVHHTGKNGEQRGTSRREDVLDTVISLKRPCDYTPDKGAVFEVHFTKNRGIYGSDVQPFEASLQIDGDLQSWELKPLEQSTAERVALLLKEGLTQKAIALELEMTPGAISKARKKAQALGLT